MNLLSEKVDELLERCAQKGEHIHKLEVAVECLELALDSAGQTIENLQVWVCCCNENVVRIVNKRDLVEESVETRQTA